MRWAREMRGVFGATPIAGEELAEFRYLLLYLGTVDEGGRLELLEPVNDGFLTRFLAKRGEGAHHLTFSVPDVAASVERARELGYTVVGEDYVDARWREAFLMPDAVHGIVIQLAETDRTFPPASLLLSTQERDPSSGPGTRGATAPDWWTTIWDTEAGPRARLASVTLASTDLAASRRLFAGLLGGSVSDVGDEVRCAWAGGRICVRHADTPGVSDVTLRADAGSLWIGQTRIGT